MAQYQRTRIVLVIMVILMIMLGLLAGAGKAMVFYKQSVSQKAVVRGVESLSNASLAIAEGLSETAKTAAYDKYEVFERLSHKTEDKPFKESMLDDYYKRGIIASMKESIGGEDNLTDYISGLIPQPSYGTVTVDKSCHPHFSLVTGKEGRIVSASICDVVLKYDSVPGATRTEKMRFDIEFPKVTFYAGDEEMLDYCVMAAKGIYIQGATSSFVGNIFAGEHAATESREIEVSYGEIASYGGINVLRTQVGIQAEKIVSLADMNLSGSFVIASPQDNNSLKCYIRQLRKMRGYDSESMCSIEGDVYDIRELPEKEMDEYSKTVDMANASLSSLYDIPFYYDSDNDPYYEGTYRKIISSEDVEIKDSITGIVFTPGNVIVDVDCNVEGLIMCGDRVYLQGNNSIVSNASIVKKILADEIDETNDRKAASEDGVLSEEERSDVFYHALDYIGGLTYPGIEYPDYYIIPYQE